MTNTHTERSTSVIRGGTLIGLMHNAFQKQRNLYEHCNRQDAFEVVELMGGMVKVGVISDGMGSGKNSGVGAGLIANHMAYAVASELVTYVAFDTANEYVPESISMFAGKALSTYLDNLLRLQYGTLSPTLANTVLSKFVDQYLMATCLIVCDYQYAGQQVSFVVYRGDGYVITRKGNKIASHELTIDNDIQGHVYYPAGEILKTQQMRPFHVFDTGHTEFDAIAIASDAWEELPKASRQLFFDGHDDDKELIEDVLFFGRNTDLTMMTNDDLSVVVVERMNHVVSDDTHN